MRPSARRQASSDRPRRIPTHHEFRLGGFRLSRRPTAQMYNLCGRPHNDCRKLFIPASVTMRIICLGAFTAIVTTADPKSDPEPFSTELLQTPDLPSAAPAATS